MRTKSATIRIPRDWASDLVDAIATALDAEEAKASAADDEAAAHAARGDATAAEGPRERARECIRTMGQFRVMIRRFMAEEE